MRAILIAASLALVGCGADSSSGASDAAAYAMAETAVHREFPNAVIAHPVINTVSGASVVCGYVSRTTPPVFPIAAFIWTTTGLEISRWGDERYAEFDFRARRACGANWVQPSRIPAVS
jgi:hypothetical protein